MPSVIVVSNETHWKSSDVLRIVRAARDRVNIDTVSRIEVAIRWAKGPMLDYRIAQREGTVYIDVNLPRRGAQELHPNAMVALAAAGIDSKTPILPVVDSFYFANRLAWDLMRIGETLDEAIVDAQDSINPPPWGNSLVITKYADPAKDGAFRDFISKKEKELRRIKAREDKWAQELERVKANHERALRERRAIETSIRNAKKRRGL